MAQLFTLYHLVEAASKQRITPEKIRLDDFMLKAHHEAAGAMVVFCGNVRDQSDGRQTTGLYYEAYPELAEELMIKIEQEAISEFKLIAALSCHRTGYVAVGETAVIVLTYGAHRRESYEANSYIIDRIKTEVPIWKKEHYSDGPSEWKYNQR